MKKLLLLLLFCLILSGCSSGSGSPPASSIPSEAVSEDPALSSEKTEYQEIELCGYTAEVPKSWIIADNYFFCKKENEFPYVMVYPEVSNESLDAFLGDSNLEETFIKQFSKAFESASYGPEMDHDIYGDLETRSFTTTYTRNKKLENVTCTLVQIDDAEPSQLQIVEFVADTAVTIEGICNRALCDLLLLIPVVSSDQEITTDTPTELQDASAESNPMAETPETEPVPVEEEPIEQEPVAEEPVEEEPVEQEPVAEEPVADQYSPTPGEQNALASAKRYINYSPFSYSGLIDQLKYEGFTDSEAAYGADNCGADWYEQALKSAEKYLNYSAFSYSGLIEQLEYEGYTEEEASYGVDNCGADWNEQAAKKAQQYLDYSSFSRSGLIDQLEYEGFTPDQAEYGVSQVYN